MAICNKTTHMPLHSINIPVWLTVNLFLPLILKNYLFFSFLLQIYVICKYSMNKMQKNIQVNHALSCVPLPAVLSRLSIGLKEPFTSFPSSMSIPNRSLWTMCRMSPCVGCRDAAWVDTWKLPGTWVEKYFT